MAMLNNQRGTLVIRSKNKRTRIDEGTAHFCGRSFEKIFSCTGGLPKLWWSSPIFLNHPDHINHTILIHPEMFELQGKTIPWRNPQLRRYKIYFWVNTWTQYKVNPGIDLVWLEVIRGVKSNHHFFWMKSHWTLPFWMAVSLAVLFLKSTMEYHGVS